MRWTGAIAVVAALLPGGCLEDVPIEDSACSDAHPCPAGFDCIGEACKAQVGDIAPNCKVDTDCTVGVCQPTLGFCVQCTEAAHCPRSSCLTEHFVCGCAVDADCETGVCLARSATCVSCQFDTDCASGKCDRETGECEKLGKDRPGDG